MTEEALDRRFSALGGVEPPRALQARILAEVGVSAETIAAVVAAPSPSPIPAASPASASSSWGGGAEPPRNAPPRGASPARRYGLYAAAILPIAALVLFALPRPPERADPAQLVPRGAGEVVPTLDLRVAVRSGDAVERLAAGRVYDAGDTLLFRVSASAPLEVVLRRNEVVLYRGAVPAGDTDLPVGYALEAGEGPARFVLEGGGAVVSVELPGVAP